MKIEVRPITPSEYEAAHDVLMSSLATRPSPYDPDRPQAPDDRRLVALDHGEVVGHLGLWDFDQRFGGRWVPCAGVSSVAVASTHRGRGIARRLMQVALEAMRERGSVVSALFPATQTLYRRQGYELAGVWLRRSVPTRALAGLPAPTRPVDVRTLVDGDLDGVLEVHAAVEGAHPGGIRLDPIFGRRRYLPTDGDEGHKRLVAERDGDVVGALVFRHVEAPEFFDLQVELLVATDTDAELALWRVLGASSSVAASTHFIAAPADHLRFWLPERDLRPVGADWVWLLRLVDAAGAIAARGFPDHLSAELDLDVDDASAAWNAGPHTLRLEGGRGELTAGGSGRVRVDVGALASLYSGYATASDLARMGRIVGVDARDVAFLDAVFSGPTPWLRTFF